MTTLTDMPVTLFPTARDMIAADKDFAGFVIDAFKTFTDAITAGDIADLRSGFLGDIDGAGHFMKFTDKNGVDLFLQKFPDGITVMVAADFKN